MHTTLTPLLLPLGRIGLGVIAIWALVLAYRTIRADADHFRAAHPGLVWGAVKEAVLVSGVVNLLWAVLDEGAHPNVLWIAVPALALAYFTVRLFFAALPTIAGRYRTTRVFDIRVVAAVATVVLASSAIYRQGGLLQGTTPVEGGTFVYFSVVDAHHARVR